MTSDSSGDENKPPRSRLGELKPFIFKQGNFENDSEEQEFNEFLTMTNMVTPKNKIPTVPKHRISDSSYMESSEELDYTISPNSQFFR